MESENSNRSKILLYHWVGIIKELYPNKKTQNPYSTDLSHLEVTDQLLLKDVLHCITLINGSSRVNERQELIST